MRYSPSISQAIIAVKIGAEDLIVSEKETATYFKVMREHTIVANLEKGIEAQNLINQNSYGDLVKFNKSAKLFELGKVIPWKYCQW